MTQMIVFLKGNYWLLEIVTAVTEHTMPIRLSANPTAPTNKPMQSDSVLGSSVELQFLPAKRRRVQLSHLDRPLLAVIVYNQHIE